MQSINQVPTDDAAQPITAISVSLMQGIAAAVPPAKVVMDGVATVTGAGTRTGVPLPPPLPGVDRRRPRSASDTRTRYVARVLTRVLLLQ